MFEWLGVFNPMRVFSRHKDKTFSQHVLIAAAETVGGSVGGTVGGLAGTAFGGGIGTIAGSSLGCVAGSNIIGDYAENTVKTDEKEIDSLWQDKVSLPFTFQTRIR
jgi:uncharacterized protein YcfJ